ncbi:MAG: phosphatidate cytidylyltransferase [Halanaerobiales bacterium]
MLWERVISAIVGIILLILFIFWGSIPFAILVMAIAIIASFEYDRLLPLDYNNNKILLSFFSIIIILYTYLNSKGIIDLSSGLFFTVTLFTLFVYHIFRMDTNSFLERLGYNLIGIVYIAGGLIFFILLRDFNIQPFTNTAALWLALLATWAEDTGAYFIGIKFGKNKLSDISPKKSVEGAIGGIVFTIIVIAIYTYILGAFSYYWIVYSIFAAIIAMIGDLFESSIKRYAGVKDSGTIIPGHGGVLDRFDSLLFSIPFTYFFLVYVI